MTRREREILEHAVHAVTEQVTNAALILDEAVVTPGWLT